jgi:hypothetical protein
MCHITSMPSVNLRQLRDTRERDRVIARIVPKRTEEKPAKWPDFEARAREIFGDRVLTIVDDLIKDWGRF